MSKPFMTLYTPHPDEKPFGYIPPFSNLSIVIDFTACANLATRKAMVYTQLENHLVGTHNSVNGVDGWTGPLAVEAQAFLTSIAPDAVLTSITNNGYVK